MHPLRGMMIFTDSLAARYTPLRHIKKRAGKVAEKVQLMDIIKKAKENDYWRLAMYCAVVAVGSGCRGGEEPEDRRQGAAAQPIHGGPSLCVAHCTTSPASLARRRTSRTSLMPCWTCKPCVHMVCKCEDHGHWECREVCCKPSLCERLRRCCHHDCCDDCCPPPTKTVRVWVP